MKKIKVYLGVALFGAMSFGAFTAYDYVTMSEEERLFLANIEALTSYEPGGGGDGSTNCYNGGTYLSGAHYYYCLEEGYCRQIKDHTENRITGSKSCTPVY